MYTYTVNVSMLGHHFFRVDGLTTEVRAQEVARLILAGFDALQVSTGKADITRWTVPTGQEVPLA